MFSCKYLSAHVHWICTPLTCGRGGSGVIYRDSAMLAVVFSNLAINDAFTLLKVSILVHRAFTLKMLFKIDMKTLSLQLKLGCLYVKPMSGLVSKQNEYICGRKLNDSKDL